jgi:iron complex transport system permease protein
MMSFAFDKTVPESCSAGPSKRPSISLRTSSSGGHLALIYGGAIAVLVLVLILNLAMGPAAAHVTALQALYSLVHHLFPMIPIPPNGLPSDADIIVWQLRLPRALMAIMIGGLLGYAGVALQGLLMNPLADPYTVGVSAGAAVGAALAETLGFSILLGGLGGVATAFVLAMLAVWLVYAISKVGGRVSIHTFILAGVVVGGFLWSTIPLLLVLANRSNDLARMLFYLIGSLQQSNWSQAEMLFPFLFVVAWWFQVWAQDLNLMTLGEETAAHLGVEIESLKKRVLLLASLGTAAAVSAGGIIGFVGLVTPHAARKLVGPDHKRLLPLAAIFGAILLIASDTIVRVFLNDMPVGVVTSIVGAPVFCLLLRRRKIAGVAN